MKPTQNQNKSPYKAPPVKLRAEILPDKIPKPKSKESSSNSSDSEQSSYDSEVQEFANEFYDESVKQADKSLQQKKDNLMKPQQQPQLNQQNNQNLKDKENSKINKTLTQQQKLSARLNELKASFKDLDMDSILFKKKDQKKLKQIAEFLSKKHKEKRDFMRKMKKIKNSQKEKRKIEEEMIKKQQSQQHSKRLKEIRNLSVLIKDKIQKKKQEEEQKLQDIEAFYEKFHKKYRKQKLYKLMQLSEKQRRNKEIQKQREYLKQRKNAASQIISAEDISEFKKKREELLRDMQQVRQAQKDQKNSQIAEKNRQLRERIYIGNRYIEMQEQETRRQKIKQIPKQKLNKVKKYNSYVKQNFLPAHKSDEDDENEKQIQEEDSIFEMNGNLFRKIRRPRYLKGLKIGEVIENVPLPKTEKETRMVGNGYLQQLKLLPRKKHSQSLNLSRKSQQKSKPMTSRVEIPKISRKMGRVSLSKNPSRQQIQGLISSLKARDGLIERKQHYLKVINKGDTNSNPEKSALDEDLLDNIEKKIKLLSKL